MKSTELLQRLQSQYGETDDIVAVFSTFSDYIESNRFFELFFSEKLKTLFAIFLPEDMDDEPLEEARILEDADDLLEFLVHEIIKDVMGLKLNGEHMSNRLAQNEIDEVHKRIEPMLNHLGGDWVDQFKDVLEEWSDV